MRQKICDRVGFDFQSYTYLSVNNKVNLKYDSDLITISKPIFNLTGGTIPTSPFQTIIPPSSSTYTFKNEGGSHKLNFQFTGDSLFFTSQTANVRIGVYRYNTFLNSFENNPYFFTGFSFQNGDLIKSADINQNNLIIDSDYLIKLFFSYSAKTKSICSFFTGDTFESSTSGGTTIQLEPFLEHIFYTFEPAKKPSFIIDSSFLSPPDGELINERLPVIESSQTVFNTSFFPAGDVGLSLNGITLTRNLDFIEDDLGFLFLTGGTVASSLRNDVVTATYIKTSGDVKYVSYVYNNSTPVLTGNTPTNLDFIYFNTDINRFVLNSSAVLINTNMAQSVIFLNGQKLTINLDYSVIVQTPNIVTFSNNISIRQNDIIQFFYLVNGSAPPTQIGDQNVDLGSFSTVNPIIGWSLSKPINFFERGRFKLQITNFSDNLYDNILNEIIIPYSGGTKNFFASLPTSGCCQEYRMRIINEKTFTSTFLSASTTSITISNEIFVDTNNPLVF